MTRYFIALLFAFAASASAAGNNGLAGVWKIHQSIAGNDADLICTFTVKDNVIGGSCGSNENPSPVKGALDGKKVTWQFDTDWNGQSLTLTYTATLTDSDSFTGNVDVQPFEVSGEFSASPADAAPAKPAEAAPSKPADATPAKPAAPNR